MQKDLCLKRYLSDKRHFADLINDFAGEVQEACRRMIDTVPTENEN